MTFFVFSVLPAPDSPLGGRGREGGKEKGEWEEKRGREENRRETIVGERKKRINNLQHVHIQCTVHVL